MNTEIQQMINSLEAVLNGQPWYGKAVYELLDEVAEKKVYQKTNDASHSMIDLLYHMLTWAEFTQHRIEKEPIKDMAAFDATDWREIDSSEDSWKKGVAALKASHQKIIALLQTKDDAFLTETVDYRQYDFRYLINGLIQHNIYHIGQVAFAAKSLDN